MMLVHVYPKKIAYRNIQHIFESTQNKPIIGDNNFIIKKGG